MFLDSEIFVIPARNTQTRCRFCLELFLMKEQKLSEISMALLRSQHNLADIILFSFTLVISLNVMKQANKIS